MLSLTLAGLPPSTFQPRAKPDLGKHARSQPSIFGASEQLSPVLTLLPELLRRVDQSRPNAPLAAFAELLRSGGGGVDAAEEEEAELQAAAARARPGQPQRDSLSYMQVKQPAS